ncbi:hypothetical protein KA111_02075 [Candidatus Woesebacteria bacterium]|nr:hypothetical protein [Candidatus Woesebacteria bacterium]
MKKQILKYKKLLITKFKFVDIFGLLLIFFVISLSYLLLNRKVEYLNITLRLFNYEGSEYGIGTNKPRPWYVEQIKPGKKLVGGFGQTLIEVTDVYNYEGPSTLQDTYVTLKIRAAQNKTSKQYIYNGSPLLIHDVRSFKVQDLLIIGEIIDIEDSEINIKKETKKFLISLDLFSQLSNNINRSDVVIEGVEDYIANSIEKGMKIKDSNNNVVVEIIDMTTSPGIRSWVGPNGYVETVDPNRTKVKLKVEIVGEEINNYYYYRREAPFIVGGGLHLIFNNTSVVGTITDVKPLSEN